VPTTPSQSRSAVVKSIPYRSGGNGFGGNWFNDLSEADYMNYLLWLKQMGAYNNISPASYYNNNKSSSFQKRRR